jgi:fructan beta-fructosidase
VSLPDGIKVQRRWSVSLMMLVLPLMCSIIAGSAEEVLYNEPFRPQFHFTPQKNWMNDPNGLVFYKGEYHLFFQYNPFGPEWGHMSWGHSISTDLVHWEELPVALSEQNGVMIFSGSVVVDWHNTSGFCKGSKGGGHSCLVAIYTGYDGKIQNQNIAYSNDRGRTWEKYSHNPVIDLNMDNFRDPKVFWYEPEQKWVMVTVLSAQHKVRLFSSTDLKRWMPLSDFGPAAAVQGVWECPDLFQLPIENKPGQNRWVLSVNINPGGIAGGSGGQYFIGNFDGTTFVNENPSGEVLWADYGKDFYASTSFSDIPSSDGRRIWIGWLDNWQYAGKVPTFPWRGQQTIPRRLKLKSLPEGIRLLQEPIAELKALREQNIDVQNMGLSAANRVLKSKRGSYETLEIEAVIDPEKAKSFGLEVRTRGAEKTIVGIDLLESKLFLDRTHSGLTSFDPDFAGRQTAPLKIRKTKTIELHIFIDRCSIEVFANRGETVISNLIFPSATSKDLKLYSKDGEIKIKKLRVWSLKSAWIGKR